MQLVEDSSDSRAVDSAELLEIKTHYEALDIAGNNKIYYLKFRFAGALPDLDDHLYSILKETENVEPGLPGQYLT
jgi:hypothetical protein